MCEGLGVWWAELGSVVSHTPELQPVDVRPYGYVERVFCIRAVVIVVCRGCGGVRSDYYRFEMTVCLQCGK